MAEDDEEWKGVLVSSSYLLIAGSVHSPTHRDGCLLGSLAAVNLLLFLWSVFSGSRCLFFPPSAGREVPHITLTKFTAFYPPGLYPPWAKEVMFIFALCMGNRGSCEGFDGQVLDWRILRQACMNTARSCFQWRPSSLYTSCQWREDGQGFSHGFQRKQPVLALVLVSLSLPFSLDVSPSSILNISALSKLFFVGYMPADLKR